MQRAAASTPHHTRVAMSHTANALSCGDPAARNWPHGLQHNACGGASASPNVPAARIFTIAHRNRLLHVSVLQRCAPPRRWGRKASDACTDAQRLDTRAKNHTACRTRMHRALSPTASAGAETESQVHKHTPPACASARKFLAIGRQVMAATSFTPACARRSGLLSAVLALDSQKVNTAPRRKATHHFAECSGPPCGFRRGR